MRRVVLALALALALAPSATAEDPEVCHDAPEILFACVGGGEVGSCDDVGYRYDQVLVMTPAGYVWLIGDSYCTPENEDNNVIVGVGTPAGSASLWWYASEGCRMMPRVYDPFGPLVVENLDCPAGARPPDPGWGSVLS